MQISSSKFQIKSDGDLIVRKISATDGTIGAFTIDADEIKSSTNIGMSSATKMFSINSTTFGNTGIQLDYNSGTPRFFAGKSTGGFVKFDGSDIEISASAFLMGSTGSAYISASRGQLEISSSKFQIKPTGDVLMSGKITTTEGTIGGFKIGSTTLSSSATNANSTTGSILISTVDTDTSTKILKL